MKLKLDDDGHVVVNDGKPVYVDDAGKEIAFDAPGTIQTISARNAEAKANRERAEAAESKLKAFEGIEDPAAALDAMKKISGLKDKDLIDAGKVEEIKAQAIKAVEEKYQPIVQERDALTNELRSEKIGGSFARSKFITEKLAVPSDMVEAMFGKHFSIEGGKILAKDANGNQIYSKSNPGNPADFDEALDSIVSSYAGKDHILKGNDNQGSGKQPGSNGGGSNAKSISRSDFEALDPASKASKMKEGVSVTD